MEETAIGVLLVVVAAIFWGVSNAIVRVGLQSIKAASGAILTLLGALTVTLSIALAFELKALLSVSLVAIGWFALIGILHFALGRFFLYQGIRYIGAARAVPIANSQPLFAIMFAAAFFGETLTVLAIVGALLICGGLYLLLSEGIEASLTKKSRILGYGFGLGTALCWGAIAVLIRYQASQFAPPIVVVTFALLFGVVTLLVATGKRLEIGLKTNKKAINSLLLSGFLTGIALASFYTALTMVPVMVVSPIAATNPLITIICVHLFLQRLERVTPRLVIGSFLVVIGAALVVI